jgi:hypothetical protein
VAQLLTCKTPKGTILAPERPGIWGISKNVDALSRPIFSNAERHIGEVLPNSTAAPKMRSCFFCRVSEQGQRPNLSIIPALSLGRQDFGRRIRGCLPVVIGSTVEMKPSRKASLPSLLIPLLGDDQDACRG